MSMKRTLAGLAILSLAMCASTARATLLDDGGFDNATSGSQTSGSAWVLTTNSPDGVNRSAQFQTGFANANSTGVGGTQAPGVGTGVWLRSFEGNQGGSGEPLAQADFTQSIVAPTSGEYVLSFVAGREVNFTASAYGVSLVSSGTGGSVSIDLLAAVIPDGNVGSALSTNPGGTPFSLNLLGVTAGDLLTVTGFLVDGADSQIPGGQSAFLDSLDLSAVTAVSEPASIVLLALGSAGVFGVRRRRDVRRGLPPFR